MHRRTSRSTNTMLLLDTTDMHCLEALDIPKPRLKQGTHQAGEESNERKSLERALQTALADAARRVCRTTAIILVVLRREDERREPQVRQDPGQGREVAFVLPYCGQDGRKEVEKGGDGGLESVSECCSISCGDGSDMVGQKGTYHSDPVAQVRI